MRGYQEPRYEAQENIPHGWEIVDTDATPARTLVVGLTKEQADMAVAELNRLQKYLDYYNP